MSSDAGDGWARRSASFDSGDQKIASVGARTLSDDETIDLNIQLWHKSETSVTDITHRVAVIDGDGDHAAEVALVAPFAGDHGEPPDVSLSPASPRPGIRIDVDDLGDIADETIVMQLRVEPYSETVETLTLDSEVKLDEGGLLGGTFTLDAELEFDSADVIARS